MYILVFLEMLLFHVIRYNKYYESLYWHSITIQETIDSDMTPNKTVS